jgi:hypothetical protein
MEISTEKARRLHDEAPEWFKQELEDEFGKETFEKKEYERLNSFDDCCRACSTTEEEFNKKFLHLGLSPDTLNLERLGIINKAINDPNWKPDHTNHDQKKWFPIFKASSSGFGFSNSYYLYEYSCAYVGSRLCSENEERSTFSGTRFAKYWEAFITNKEV